MWNPFKAIGDAIGNAVERVFGRDESAPTSQPERQPEPEIQLERQPEPQERGFFGQIWDRVSGADRRRDELETRERQLEERQQQIEVRERQLEERQQQIEAREQAIPPTAPVPAPTPEQAIPPAGPASAPERELPKFASDTPDYLARDERAFGTDSDIGRELEGTVAEFIMDRGGLQGLSADAREWLQNPTVSGPFSEYWHSGGFSADQVLAGMTNISNIRIEEGDDGEIHIEFDYDAEVDGYEVSGHASS
jgi:hypothetical protein